MPTDHDSAAPSSLPAQATHGKRLLLTDFLSRDALRELQETFTALTLLPTVIVDNNGQPLTPASDPAKQAMRSEMLENIGLPNEAAEGDGPIEAPIIVDDQRLGAVVMDVERLQSHTPEAREKLVRLCLEMGVPADSVESLLAEAEAAFAPRKSAAAQSVFLLARQLARLCDQGRALRERLEELDVLNRLSALLAGHRDLQHILDTAARSAVEVLNAKAGSLRLYDESKGVLTVSAAYNLSPEYLRKLPMPLTTSHIATVALSGEVVFIEDMATDPRVIYHEDAQREGLVSILAAGMIYRGQKIGVIQVYSGVKHRFSRSDANLLQSIARLTATAIQNTRLDAMREEGTRVQRQLRLAADVQRRMLPSSMPKNAAFDIAARYLPSLELGGDFYDFIQLEDNVGCVIGDVAGKGVAASLLMASVRASLRAYAQDLYDIDQIVSRVNVALSRDTLASEFVTLIYGVLDPKSLRLTYCNAGHEPAVLLRNGEITRLETGGMIVGVDTEQVYEKGVVQLKPGDLLVLYTDGLTDALNFNDESFGRDRIFKAMRDVADKSAQDVVNHILWEMRRFTGLKPSFDDTTLVAIKVTGGK